MEENVQGVANQIEIIYNEMKQLRKKLEDIKEGLSRKSTGHPIFDAELSDSEKRAIIKLSAELVKLLQYSHIEFLESMRFLADTLAAINREDFRSG